MPSQHQNSTNQEITKLLSRQKLLEDLVKRQDMPRHELVESLVQKQNLTEINKFIEKLGSKEIARILENLPEMERNGIWAQVPDARRDEVLLDISDSIRVELVSNMEQKTHTVSIKAFDLYEGRLRQIPISSKADLEKSKPIWVDLITPEEEQLEWASDIFGVNIPNPKSLTDLETSARFYFDDDGEIHLHSNFLLDQNDKSKNITVAFIIKGNTLFSVRNEELPVFRLQRVRAKAQTNYVSEAKDVLLDLYAADVEYSANALEDIYTKLESVGAQVFQSHMTNYQAAKILTAISEEEDLSNENHPDKYVSFALVK